MFAQVYRITRVSAGDQYVSSLIRKHTKSAEDCARCAYWLYTAS